MDINNKQIKDAIEATVAKSILENLDELHRDALLQKTMVRVIGDYDFTRAVEKVVSARAAEIAAKMAESEEWTLKIEHTIRNGFDDYLRSLRANLPKAIMKMLHGDNDISTYRRGPGLILGDWPKVDADED